MMYDLSVACQSTKDSLRTFRWTCAAGKPRNLLRLPSYLLQRYLLEHGALPSCGDAASKTRWLDGKLCVCNMASATSFHRPVHAPTTLMNRGNSRSMVSAHHRLATVHRRPPLYSRQQSISQAALQSGWGNPEKTRKRLQFYNDRRACSVLLAVIASYLSQNCFGAHNGLTTPYSKPSQSRDNLRAANRPKQYKVYHFYLLYHFVKPYACADPFIDESVA